MALRSSADQYLCLFGICTGRTGTSQGLGSGQEGLWVGAVGVGSGWEGLEQGTFISSLSPSFGFGVTGLWRISGHVLVEPLGAFGGSAPVILPVFVGLCQVQRQDPCLESAPTS